MLSSVGRRRLWLPLLGLLALVAVACSDVTTGTKPSPEAIETAESISEEVKIVAPYSSTPVPGEEEQPPVVLDGQVFGSGPTGVILAHMRPSDQSSWFPFATKLASTGEFTALTFNFRGYEGSTGDKAFDRVDTDLAAAYQFMRDVIGISKIYLVGASMGGTASLIVASEYPVEGVAAISAPAQFDSLDALLAASSIHEPKLFIASEDDVPAFHSLADFMEVAPEPKEQVVYDGNAHATDIFDGPHGPDLEQELLNFLDGE